MVDFRPVQRDQIFREEGVNHLPNTGGFGKIRQNNSINLPKIGGAPKISSNPLETHSAKIGAPVKNHFLSWCSKIATIFKFHSCKTSEKKINLLTNKINNGNLDFLRLKELHNEGKINQLEFLNVSIGVFKNLATEEKGLINILCEECGLEEQSEAYSAIFSNCLMDHELRDTPILTADIPERERHKIVAKNDCNTNPDPEFCKTVMQAKSVDEVMDVFKTFFEEKIADADNKTQRPDLYGLTQKEYYKKQQNVFCQGGLADIPRHSFILELGPDSRVEWEPELAKGVSGMEIFKRLFEEIKEQGKLSDGETLNVMKQFLLAWRGQNGTSEQANLLLSTLNQCQDFIQTGSVACNFGDHKQPIVMKFQSEGSHFTLSSKEEGSQNVALTILDGGSLSSECRLKFLDDPEEQGIRTGISVMSTRKQSSDGTIQWSCQFRENPPQQVIFYGGNRLKESDSQ
ncbi:MAG: hypothetical protein LBJ13_02845 [Puniceicoccales bacterium]|jgi:hypothetical protein|nr:hypothetical protein [Puniceicoccales bacterium]